jgi:hypothetical protein
VRPIAARKPAPHLPQHSTSGQRKRYVLSRISISSVHQKCHVLALSRMRYFLSVLCASAHSSYGVASFRSEAFGCHGDCSDRSERPRLYFWPMRPFRRNGGAATLWNTTSLKNRRTGRRTPFFRTGAPVKTPQTFYILLFIIETLRGSLPVPPIASISSLSFSIITIIIS